MRQLGLAAARDVQQRIAASATAADRQTTSLSSDEDRVLSFVSVHERDAEAGLGVLCRFLDLLLSARVHVPVAR